MNEVGDEIKKTAITDNKKISSTESSQSSKSSHIHQSVLYMTFSMSLLFMGYEFARSGLMALITTSTISASLSTSSMDSTTSSEDSTSNRSSSYYSIAMAFITPCSVILLLWYEIYPLFI